MKKFILFVVAFIALDVPLLHTQTTYTFNYTGGVQSYTVPANISILSLTVSGAQGGGSSGLGATYVQTIGVTPGQILNLYVGGMGNSGAGTAGGYNGGGQAGGNYGNEGSGGGASDIRVSPYGLANRIIVAGGGGGRGGWSGGAGGAGGLVGSAGQAGQGGGGGGGTASSGGSGASGNGCGNGGSGTLAIGGNGGVCSYGGGGGGGGYYGGGGGGADNNSCCADGGGGGGGSSYCATPGGTCTAGVRYGAGQILIKPLSGLSIVMTSPIICNGQLNASLSATVSGGVAPYTYSWSTSATTPTIGNLGAGTYSCWATSASSVSYFETFIITQPPALFSGINNQYNVTCNGGNNGYISIYANGGVPPYSYTWSPSGGNSASASGLTAGIYTCTIADGNACTRTETINLTQPAAPSIVAFATSSAICIGGSVTLIGGGASSYTWSNGVTNGVPFSPATSATYVVTGFNSSGCPGYAQTSVIVNPLPTVTVNSPYSSCYGAPTTLTASGASTYVWNNNTTGSSIIITPTVTATYSVTGTSSLGCTKSATTSVSIYSLPIVSVVMSNTAVCAGSPVTMIGVGALTYTWSNGLTNATPFVPLATAVYTVYGADGNGCINNTTRTVVVNSIPVLSVNGSTSVCNGNSTTLTASGANSYTWNTSAVSLSISVTPQVSSNYSVTGASVEGCTASATFSVVVGTLPNVTASVNTSLICFGKPVTLSANGAATYTWLPLQSNSSSITITPSITTTYTLLGNLNGCDNSDSITLAVKPSPTLVLVSDSSSICEGNSVSITVTGAATYSWSTSDTSATISVSPNVNTTYVVTGFNSDGCADTASHFVLVDPCTGISVTNKKEIFIQIYPNPNSGSFYIVGQPDLKLNITNNLGQVVKTFVTTGNDPQLIDANELSNGIYFISGKINNKAITQKIIIAH